MQVAALVVAILSLVALCVIGLLTYRINVKAVTAARKSDDRAELERISRRASSVAEILRRMRASNNERVRLGHGDEVIPVGSPENLERLRYQEALKSSLAALGQRRDRMPRAVALSNAVGTAWGSTEIAQAILEVNRLLNVAADARELPLKFED